MGRSKEYKAEYTKSYGTIAKKSNALASEMKWIVKSGVNKMLIKYYSNRL